MIYKKIKKILLGIICLGLLITTNVVAETPKKGVTLGTMRQKLKTLQAEEQARKNKENQTKGEIKANQASINKAEQELAEAQIKIDETKIAIEKMGVEIEKAKTDSEELLVIYQKLTTENIYLPYITGASTMTDLIMRIDAVNQISEANKNELNRLESLVKNNAKLEKELARYQIELDEKIDAHEKAIVNLNDELKALEEGTLTVAENIEAIKEQIKYFEGLGCKEDQELLSCINIADNQGWLKPISKGRVTSLYGPRKSPTGSASSYHRGIDIGIAEGTKVYGAANGTVGAITRKASCGGNMVYVWAYVNGKPYTYVYMHLLEIHVNVGDTVTTGTVIGLSGGGKTSIKHGGYDKCTTGAHLHLGISQGAFWGSDIKKYPLSKFNSHTMNPPGYPGLYQWFYSRY